MADTNVAPSGSETSISVTVGGVPKILNGQIDGWTVKEESVTVSVMPIGTMNVPKAKDLRGHSGTLSCKPTNPTLHQVRDLIDVAARAGLPLDVTLRTTERFRDGTSSSYTYLQVLLTDFSHSAKRGEANGTEVRWETGYPRVAG